MLRSGANEAMAEEIAQETMLTVWRKADLFVAGSHGAAAWIFTIARNLRIDALRRKQRGNASSSESDNDDARIAPMSHPDKQLTPEAQFAAAQSEENVRKAMAQLSDEQMRVIELSFFEEKTHSEIAEHLQIPLGTVKSRSRLALARLRALLGRHVMTPDPHPSDIDLAAFAAGKLDETQRDEIVAHIRGCAPCRAFVSTIEHVGGIILDSLPPTPLADRSLTEVMARIDQTARRRGDSPVFVPRSRPGAPASSALIRAPLVSRTAARISRRRWRQLRLIILSLGIAYLAGEYAFFRYVDDYPASTATTGKVAIGGSTTGNIERARGRRLVQSDS